MEQSLFTAVGGRDVVAEAVRRLYDRMLTDPVVAGAFVDVDLRRLRGHMQAFLTGALGGETEYDGRDLRTAHATVHITDDMFDRTVSHLVDTLSGLGCEPDVTDEVVVRLAALRDQVVTPIGTVGRDLGSP